MIKKLVMFLMVASCLQTVPADFFAADFEVPQTYEDESKIQVLADDVIVYKFRTYNGKRQYRRWNDSKGCWVDPDWIDM